MSLTKSERWILSEFRVARDRSSTHGDVLLAHRFETPYAEIDLCFETSSGDWLMIEVKSWDHDIWGSDFISRRQLQRLERARLWLEAKRLRVRSTESTRRLEQRGAGVRLLLAVVPSGPGKRIRYFQDFSFLST